MLLIYINFALVYILWGSTYAANYTVVNQGIPPALAGGIRFLIAGFAMLLFCWLTKRQLRVDRKSLFRLTLIGILLLSTGNVFLVWAQLYVSSGLAALMLATVPFWITLIEVCFAHGERLMPRGLAGLILGLFGLSLVLWTRLIVPKTDLNFLLASCLLIVSAISWALGSVCSRRWTQSIDPFVASGYEMVFAGLLNLTVSLALGDPARSEFTTTGIGALTYLIIAGSWVGFTAYIWLLKNVETSKVATFAYVNPVVAVIIGYLFLGETLRPMVVVGGSIIIASVWLVNTSKVRSGQATLVQRK